MTRVGAIDCGTNSIRLLIADVDPGSGSLTDLARRMEVVRLGHGVDRTGVIAPEAMARTVAQAREYASQCVELGVERVRFVATSASRDASNAQEFVAGVRQAFAAFGVAPDVISGHEEASLSFRGATGDLRADGIPGMRKPRCPSGVPLATCGPTASPAPISWWISGAAPRSSFAGRTWWSTRSLSTSGASG